MFKELAGAFDELFHSVSKKEQEKFINAMKTFIKAQEYKPTVDVLFGYKSDKEEAAQELKKDNR